MAKNSLEHLLWIEELLPEGNYIKKSMFGGKAYYIGPKIVLALFGSEGDYEHKGEVHDFEIWNGCMFPVEKMYHPALLKKFPFLVNHPVLPKWLYLPYDSEDFEDHATLIMKNILRNQNVWGTIPKDKKSKGAKTVKVKEEKISKQDYLIPRMFQDEKPEDVFAKAKKISDLRNLGPTIEKSFNQCGIKTVDQLVKTGWKKAMEKLTKLNYKYSHTLYAYAIIGALTNKDFAALSESEKQEAKDHCAFLRAKYKKLKSRS